MATFRGERVMVLIKDIFYVLYLFTGLITNFVPQFH